MCTKHGLNARVLKECISHILALIYNESLGQDNVPDDWRQANVSLPSLVFKKGEKYDAAIYRPVSLTCICCKTIVHMAYIGEQHQQIAYLLIVNMG